MEKIKEDQLLDLMTVTTEIRSVCKEPYRLRHFPFSFFVSNARCHTIMFHQHEKATYKIISCCNLFGKQSNLPLLIQSSRTKG